MFCRNCGKEIKIEASICPYCRKRYKKEETSTLLKTMFILSIISIALVFIAFHEVIIVSGILIGLISFIGGIYGKRKYPYSQKSVYTIIFSLTGLLSNISWLIFILII